MLERSNHNTKRYPAAKAFGFVAACFCIALASVLPARANAAVPFYGAKEVARSADHIEMTVGEEATFHIDFKNVGSNPWRNAGNRHISVYTAKPNYRKSIFQAASWQSFRQLARIEQDLVRPGGTASVKFTLRAPEVPGEYVESFRLAAENFNWVVGGEFSVPITVAEKVTNSAARLIQSHRELTLRRGERADLRVGFKNTGTTAWNVRTITALDGSGTFRDASWGGETKAAEVAAGVVEPGQLDLVTFAVKAPNESGSYRLRFAYITDGAAVPGGELELPVTVSEDAIPEDQQVVVPMAPQELFEAAPIFPAPPLMRVGICPLGDSAPGSSGFACPAGALVFSADSEFEVRDGTDEVLLVVPPETSFVIQEDTATKTFSATFPGGVRTFARYPRLVPRNPAAIFTVQNMESPWSNGNDNRFRGVLEVRVAPTSKRSWLVEELPMDDYVAGIAEVPDTCFPSSLCASNTQVKVSSPAEFLKAQAVAARTYALFYMLAGGKYGDAPFILASGTADQVYRGYGSELRRPNYSSLSRTVSGVAVLWNGNIVSTYYFAQSHGHTHGYHETWGGAVRPWLVGRPALYDAGKRQVGHGIGMPQTDAARRAQDGANMETILKHYYTGVEVKKVY